MKKNIFIGFLAVVLLIVLSFVVTQNRPVTISVSGAIAKFSIENKIKAAEIIVIGNVKTAHPSRWLGNSKSDPKNASPKEVLQARGLFTDSVISVDQVLKGDMGTSAVRVRVFTGQTRKVRWTSDIEPSYIPGKTYLLFLTKDSGPTAKVEPGDYIAVGAFQGVYEIVDNKAISKDGDEWVLDELITYIEKVLSQAPPK